MDSISFPSVEDWGRRLEASATGDRHPANTPPPIVQGKGN
ncbi:hypothetical protein D082_13900 [Synechocystis sp. PCC 6714]|nr:hypothetical protein D082_13900 [Synechocystis sp. PCC 6714]